MLNPFHPLHSSIVRIRDATSAIVGAGFLMAPDLVSTCAYVVANVLIIPCETEQPPEGLVHLDFPLLGETEGTNRFQSDLVGQELNEDGEDMAVLRLTTNPLSTTRHVRLLSVSNLSGRGFEAYGFPITTNVGHHASGIMRDLLVNDYVQLEGTATQGYRVQRGYSVTPIRDQSRRVMVGMVVADDRGTLEAQGVFLIPNDLIPRACPDTKPFTLHLFAPLTDGLAGLPSSPLSCVEELLLEGRNK